MNLPERIKIVRDSMDLSQKNMAKTIGVSLTALQGYEAGRSVPGGNVFEALVKLGFNANWLLTGIGGMKLGESTYQLAEEHGGADIVNNMPVPFESLPELNQRVLCIMEVFNLDEDSFCNRVEINRDDLTRIKAGHPVSGVLIRALVFEFGLRLKWLREGELPIKATLTVDHSSRDRWGYVVAKMEEKQNNGEIF